MIDFDNMANSCRKPSPLVFDSDIAERWRMFERDYAHYIRIVHRNNPDDLKASLLLNLMGPDAMIRADTFEFARPYKSVYSLIEPCKSVSMIRPANHLNHLYKGKWCACKQIKDILNWDTFMAPLRNHAPTWSKWMVSSTDATVNISFL